MIDSLRTRIRAAAPELKAIEREPVEVHVLIQYTWPAGTSEKKKATNGMADGKPPAGDLGELFIEALEGLAYRNDGQGARLAVEKAYDPEPQTAITLAPLTEPPTKFFFLSWRLMKEQTYLEDEDQLMKGGAS